MSEDYIWKVIYWLSLASIPVLAISMRFAYLARTRGWVEVEGTIIDTRSVLLGEAPTPFVDVNYEYEARSYTAFDLNTEGNDTRDYPCGGTVALLVDPIDPTNCRVKLRSTFYDGPLQNIAARRTARREVRSR
ncbi:DUF3592 domain-containing protein [Agrobacterium rhizogenes]|jgi:hypothetical protein|uniref:DUF3592 domain-containing protein n=1 Tax=Rhizobium rhizogenes TaxID=359 RepID=UPI00123849D6|nr:DUF3592 domain-containing protein [Rhizobium rhizogenes]KAA6485334.1 DUF3592 domain-containing protein [Agrobacterium sp. ICMP 7243]NTF50157.1 DUF3592 domain-containing protein [Rhizobium rhizogenes]NTF82791.1 DUF3592 domain-containing protein [Rhizobium rhizogenes]NTG42722.1 DUF3592 domain-containing protein [Rhizobium rhizogenes]NTH07539.1 DUF3592 domain-containing protein [Rhizobium rhizogenes]